MSYDPDADLIGREYVTEGGERYRIEGPGRHRAVMRSIRLSDGKESACCRDIVRRYVVEK